MPPKSKRKRTRLDHLIPDGQECVSQQFYLTPAAALRGASASVIPPLPSTDALCDASISDDRRRILRTSIPLQPTGGVPVFDDILHPGLGEDLRDPAIRLNMGMGKSAETRIHNRRLTRGYDPYG